MKIDIEVTRQKDLVRAVQFRANQIAEKTLSTQHADPVVEYSSVTGLAAMIIAASHGIPTDSASLSKVQRRVIEALGHAVNEMAADAGKSPKPTKRGVGAPKRKV